MQPKAADHEAFWRQPGSPSLSVCLREGEYWTVVHGGIILRLRDTLGIRLLAHLLHHPGILIESGALLAAVGAGSPLAVSPRLLRARVRTALRAAIRRIATHHPALGAHLHAMVRGGRVCVYETDLRRPVRWVG